MKNENIKKLKTYLFYISIFFFAISFLHLAYKYVAETSSSEPVEGGSISEAIVGKFPTLNPLQPLKGNNEYIVGLLYRSLLQYDAAEKKIAGDIANCDISNFMNRDNNKVSIECVINENAKWSNGNSITTEDIIATYNLIKETNANPSLVGLLEGIDIQAKNNVIIFENNKTDVNFLKVFFQPILNKEIINNLSSGNVKGNFPYTSGIYSGEYTIRDVISDENLGVSKILLEKNKYYGSANIKKITIFVFPTKNALERNKQAITVFNDESNILGDSVSRFENNRYTLPQFVSLFINIDKIEHANLRATILNAVNRDNLITLLGGEKSNKAVKNPYLSDTNMDSEPKNKNFEAVMNSLGYKKKSQLIEALKTTTKDTQKQGETNASTENKQVTNIPPRNEITLERYQKDSEFITTPEYVDIYNFVTKDNILLQGTGTKDIVDEVYINEYKLKGFSPKSDTFNYRLSKELGTIKEGENNYKIYFVANGEKILKEEVNFLYYPDKEKLNTETEKFIDKLYEKEQEQNKPKPEIISSDKTKEPATQVKDTNNSELKKLENLDDKMYYSKDLQTYKISLVYLNPRKDFEETAEFIKKSLREIGLDVELKPLSAKEFVTAIEKNEYDMILGGINTGYFSFNIFPYFHSGQVETGFNYSNIKSTKLDLLLEDLKENIYTKEKTKELEDKVLKIFSQEQFFKTLYTPKYNLLIDKNIHLNKDFSELQDIALRSKMVKELYMKETTKLSLEGKSLSGFIHYIGSKLYE